MMTYHDISRNDQDNLIKGYILQTRSVYCTFLLTRILSHTAYLIDSDESILTKRQNVSMNIE